MQDYHLKKELPWISNYGTGPKDFSTPLRCCRNDDEAALAISAASFCYSSFIPSLIFFTASLERPVPFDTSSTDKPMERKRIAV